MAISVSVERINPVVSTSVVPPLTVPAAHAVTTDVSGGGTFKPARGIYSWIASLDVDANVHPVQVAAITK